MKKKILAGFVGLLALALAACGKAPTPHDRAKTAAVAVVKVIAAQDAARATIEEQARAAGCVVVGVAGGPLPPGWTAAKLAQLAREYERTHPGAVVGYAVSGKYGALVVFSCQ